MQVKDLGEFGLIKRIAGILPSAPSDVVVGIGDDVAVLKSPGDDYLLATCDVQVENVHFIRADITPFQLGCRVVAINVSDIAAMGGHPTWALVSLILPRDLPVEYVDGLYLGMQEQIQQAGAAIVGGNISKIHSEMVIDFCLLGRVERDKLVLRSGARDGDMILVTGSLGDSRAGLELASQRAAKVSEAARRHVTKRHLTPQPRLREGQILARTGHVDAMADVSDGLVGDLRHICGASRVGAELWKDELPISAESREVAVACGADASIWALGGGEDYELLLTVAPDFVAEVQRVLEEETGTKASVIGRIVGAMDDVYLRVSGGKTVRCPVGSIGWDHFGAI